MPDLSIPKEYADDNALTEEILDGIREAIQTWANTTKLDSTNIQTGGISADNLATNAVTSGKINASAVTTGKIADAAVTTAKITDSNVTTAKIADANVTTDKIADGAVTFPKLYERQVTTDGTDPGVGGLSISASSAAAAVTGTTLSDVLNLSVTITTSGRPVFVGLTSDGSENYSRIQGASSSNTSASGLNVVIIRGSSTVFKGELQRMSSDTGSSSVTIPPSAVWVVDTPEAGTYTYKVQAAKMSSLNGTGAIGYVKLLAYEI